MVYVFEWRWLLFQNDFRFFQRPLSTCFQKYLQLDKITAKVNKAKKFVDRNMPRNYLRSCPEFAYRYYPNDATFATRYFSDWELCGPLCYDRLFHLSIRIDPEFVWSICIVRIVSRRVHQGLAQAGLVLGAATSAPGLNHQARKACAPGVVSRDTCEPLRGCAVEVVVAVSVGKLTFSLFWPIVYALLRLSRQLITLQLTCFIVSVLRRWTFYCNLKVKDKHSAYRRYWVRLN